MTQISTLFGLRSSRTAISDDEASDASSEPKVSYKPDKKGKGRAATVQKEEEVEEESLMVESDNIEDEEDEEIGEDELVNLCYCGRTFAE